MSDQIVTVVTASSAAAGAPIDVSLLTVNAQPVNRQRMVLGDNTGSENFASVIASSESIQLGDFGLVTKPVLPPTININSGSITNQPVVSVISGSLGIQNTLNALSASITNLPTTINVNSGSITNKVVVEIESGSITQMATSININSGSIRIMGTGSNQLADVIAGTGSFNGSEYALVVRPYGPLAVDINSGSITNQVTVSVISGSITNQPVVSVISGSIGVQNTLNALSASITNTPSAININSGSITNKVIVEIESGSITNQPVVNIGSGSITQMATSININSGSITNQPVVSVISGSIRIMGTGSNQLASVVTGSTLVGNEWGLATVALGAPTSVNINSGSITNKVIVEIESGSITNQPVISVISGSIGVQNTLNALSASVTNHPTSININSGSITNQPVVSVVSGSIGIQNTLIPFSSSVSGTIKITDGVDIADIVPSHIVGNENGLAVRPINPVEGTIVTILSGSVTQMATSINVNSGSITNQPVVSVVSGSINVQNSITSLLSASLVDPTTAGNKAGVTSGSYYTAYNSLAVDVNSTQRRTYDFTFKPATTALTANIPRPWVSVHHTGSAKLSKIREVTISPYINTVACEVVIELAFLASPPTGSPITTVGIHDPAIAGTPPTTIGCSLPSGSTTGSATNIVRSRAFYMPLITASNNIPQFPYELYDWDPAAERQPLIMRGGVNEGWCVNVTANSGSTIAMNVNIVITEE